MDTKTFICHCGNTFNSNTGAIPPGWQTIDGALFCSGCIAVSQRHAPCGDERLAPTPIRATERDKATSVPSRSHANHALIDTNRVETGPIEVSANLTIQIHRRGRAA